MKLFSDKVAYRYSQPFSELQVNKANLYIRQYLDEIGVTITANHGDKIEFKSGAFSGGQTTLSRIERGVIYLGAEGLELEFSVAGFGIMLVVVACIVVIAIRHFFLPIPVAVSIFFIHKLITRSTAQEALALLGKRLEVL